MHPQTIEEHIRSIDPQETPSEHSIEELKPRISEKALLWKIDLRLVPLLLLIYLLNFLDRINIGNAMTLGLQADLKLQGDEVNTVLAVFYVTYICFEIPSNCMLKKIKPRVWLSMCLFVCGLMVICHGFVRSYRSLVTVRLLLGAAEAGLFPGCSYLLTQWYKREEVIRRFVVFFSAATLAGAFGSLLAGAIQQMNGTAGMTGWRWIFIIEGIATCLFSILTFLKLPGFPEDAAWLTADEKDVVMARKREATEHAELTLKQGILKIFTDIKSYLGGLASLGIMLCGYSITYFLPTIISGFHYSKTQTQLYCVAPFAAGAVWCVSLAFLSARIDQRLILILLNMAIAIAAVAVLFHVETVKVAYTATFLFTMGVFGSFPLVFCWFFMNLRGHTESAIGSAFVISAGNFGGFISTYAFLKNDAPRYQKGYAICIGGLRLTAISSTAYALCCRFSNRSRSANMKFTAW